MSIVQPLGYEVEPFSIVQMRDNSRFYISTFLLFIMLISPATIAEGESEEWYVEGGNSVLMEQFTATWCDVCAKIDPWISDFVDERGSRLIRVALHDPLNDPLGNSITSERLSNFPDGQNLAPSFWFDSSGEIKGIVQPVDLDRALLNSEGNRDSDTTISISVSKTDNNSLELTINFYLTENISNTQASIFLLADKNIDQSLATNGITTHEDVTRGYVNLEILENHTINQELLESNFNSGFSNVSLIRTSSGYTVNLNFDLVNEETEEISIVAVHESLIDGERTTLGAVSLPLGQASNDDRVSILTPLLCIMILSTVILFKDRFL